MAKFTVRVELHDGKDYNKLHEEMEKQGFTRTITSSTGIEYRLPRGEYDRVADLTKGQILKSANRAAEKLGKSHSVLVTEADSRTWYNLNID